MENTLVVFEVLKNMRKFTAVYNHTSVAIVAKDLLILTKKKSQGYPHWLLHLRQIFNHGVEGWDKPQTYSWRITLQDTLTFVYLLFHI